MEIWKEGDRWRISVNHEQKEEEERALLKKRG